MRPQLKVLAITFAMLTFLFESGLAQTAQQLGAQFAPAEAYWLRPGILMLAKFDSRDEICEALIEPVKEGKSKADRIPEKVADELIEKVAPVQSRGESQSRFLDPDSTVAGGVYNVKNNFKFVSIEKMGNVPRTNQEDTIQAIRITWTKRVCVGNR